MEQEAQPQRQTAYKILIRDIVNSEYVKQEGWTPNYLNTNRGKISKVNIIGVIISKDNGILVDDSTGTIALRTFENQEIFNGHNIGDLVLIIGKPREFNNSKYVAPDIIKKIDPLWMQVRMKEFGMSIETAQEIVREVEPLNNLKVEEIEAVVNDEQTITQTPIQNESSTSVYEKIISWIDTNDTGNGVGIDEIIMNSNIENSEKIINNLLEEGEIFEIRPGIVKVL